VEHSSGGISPATLLFLAFIVMAVGLFLALRKGDKN
jgi:hypothetical protein